MQLLLASASPARLTTLRGAGIDPLVEVAGVDEDALLLRLQSEAPADRVLALARAKAEWVASRTAAPARFILGCDSMLELEGEIMGKPGDPVTATARWKRMRGTTGLLHTGHWLIDRESGASGATSTTSVTFADLDDGEIEAYVATGEPLRVAGAFTVDGLGGPYVERIDGDHHGVVGLSLPLLRRLLRDAGVPIHTLRSAT